MSDQNTKRRCECKRCGKHKRKKMPSLSLKIFLSKLFFFFFKLKVLVIFISNTNIQPYTMMIESGCTFITKTAMLRVFSNHTVANLTLIISVQSSNKICILIQVIVKARKAKKTFYAFKIFETDWPELGQT